MNSHGNLLQFEDCPDPAVQSLADRTWEVIDFIHHGLGIKTWPGTFAQPTKIAFHRSCHSRGTATGAAARTLLSSIANATVIPFGQSEQCCGFGGTFCVTFPHISGRMGTLKLDHILDVNPDLLAGVDMSCLMHLSGLAQAQGRPVPHQHTIQILRDTLANTPAK
jgi:L-lactate dehydrogenase complex protein LldE